MTQKIIIPKKITRGSHIRVVAVSRSMSLLSSDTVERATQALKAYGFEVSFGRYVHDTDVFFSSSVASRVADLHEAFLDDSVDGILTVIGGYNSNQLLSHIDYNLIKNHPKILCGFSDITALANAITAKTGMITYSGPHFSGWAMERGFEYSAEMFRQCCLQSESYFLSPPPTWSDDPWFLDQNNRTMLSDTDYWLYNPGRHALGKIVGGHGCCLAALQGTSYMPSLIDSILLMEEDSQINPQLFDRELQSLIHQRDFQGVRGILIGRFQKESGMTRELLTAIIQQKPELYDIPIIANVAFGHTTPIATFPIGGVLEMSSDVSSPFIKIIEH